MGYIYKIQNKINNKIYIGQTRYNINKRWSEHCFSSFELNSNYPLHRAIRKYGKENFTIDIVEEISDDLLNEHEVYWIGFYHSYAPLGKGYNATLGGEGNRLYEAQVIYDLWDKGLCITQISEQIGADRHIITDILSSYSNYSIEESDRRGHELLWQKRSRKVQQYDLKGNYINTFDNLMDAQRKTGISQKNIFSAVAHKSYSAGGYQWKYINDDCVITNILNKTKRQKQAVIQILEDKEIEYESAAEASRQTGISDVCIRRVCKGKSLTAGGYKWKYKGE